MVDERNKTWLIYCHINKKNNKKYIGQTQLDINERWRKNGEGYKRCSLFYKAILKYGWENFEHIVLEENIPSLSEANKRETYYIDLFHTFVDDPECMGYNLTRGGEAHIFSQIARKNMSVAQKEYFKTHEISLEQREKLKQAHREFYSTEEGKKVASKARKKAWENEEYRRFHSAIATGGKNPAARKVQCLEEPNIIFGTVSEASKWCNKGSDSLRTHIAAQIRGKRKSCGKHPITNQPLHWRYINE